MGTQRTKKYKPKPIAQNPLVPRDAQAMEMPGLVGLTMLGNKGLNEAHIYDMLANADVAGRVEGAGPEILEAVSAIKTTCLAILARDVIGVSGDNMVVLKKNLPITLAFLRTGHPAKVWKAAMAARHEFETKGRLKL